MENGQDIADAAAFTLQLFFPLSCICCGREYHPDAFTRYPGSRSGPVPLCSRCSRLLSDEMTERPCRMCGRALISETDLCMSCRKRFKEKPPAFVRNNALFSYRGRAKSLISAYKFGNRRELAPFFAFLLDKAIRQTFDTSVPIVPVPYRPAGKKRRGWDPVEEVCSILSSHYDRIIIKPLKRKGNRQQKKMSAAEREENIRSALTFKKTAAFSSKDRKDGNGVILIDDVFTTGATLQRCAGLLCENGCPCLQAFTLVVD